jgi:RNA polymerase sigma-70 factor (ECF subfamily)
MIIIGYRIVPAKQFFNKLAARNWHSCMQLENYKTLSDEDIVRQITTHGQKELFSMLYNRYERKVEDKCYSILRNKDLAKEAKQIIFEKTYEKLNSYRGQSSFSSWLYSITYNFCIDYLRNKKKMNYPEWSHQHDLPEIIDVNPEDEEELINYENLSKILEMIHPEEKAILIMKYSDDLSIVEIAKALRLTESATKMRLKRAKARVFYLYRNTFPGL